MGVGQDMYNGMDGILDIIEEGNGSKVIAEVKKVRMQCIKALKVDEQFINNMYKLYRVVDFFYDGDGILDSKINERVYNVLKFKTSIDDNLELSKLLKFLTNAITEVVKYGYAVIGIKKNENTEDLHYDRARFETIYNLEYKLLKWYNVFVYENTLWKTDAEAVNEIIDSGYTLFVMEGQKKKGSVFSILETLVAKHYTNSNWYNGINGLTGFNVCNINSKELDEDLEFITGRKIQGNEQIRMAFLEHLRDSNKRIENQDMITKTSNVSFEHINMADTAIGSMAENYIRYLDQQIQVAIIGQAGTTMEASVGSQARSETMREATDNIRDYDMEMVKQLFIDILKTFDIKEWNKFDYDFSSGEENNNNNLNSDAMNEEVQTKRRRWFSKWGGNK